MTSMQKILLLKVNIDEVKEVVKKEFIKEFGQIYNNRFLIFNPSNQSNPRFKN
jgi:hypothetical protein